MKIPNLSRRTWLMVGFAGVAIRLLLWWFTIGTNDATEGFRLAPIVYSEGILQTYQDELEVNQPPAICIYGGQAWDWSGDNLMIFVRLMKLWGLAGEALALWALWRFAGPHAFAAYAWLPAAILVSGFHCNIDCLYAALLLVSAIAFDRRKYFLSGLLMAAACNVKLLPALLAPLLLIGAPNRRAFLRIAAALAIGVLPFVPIAIAAGPVMFRNLVAYNSNLENWGMLLLLRRLTLISSLHAFAVPAFNWFRADGRYIVVAGVLGLGLLSRLRRPVRGIGCTSAVPGRLKNGHRLGLDLGRIYRLGVLDFYGPVLAAVVDFLFRDSVSGLACGPGGVGDAGAFPLAAS